MKLLLDEMYAPALAEALRAVGLDAHTAAEGGVAGRPDAEVFAAAVSDGFVVLTENASDFARISAEHLTAGNHHPGVLVALSSRFSRRPSGIGALVHAIRSIVHQPLEDRIIYLEREHLEHPSSH